MSAHVRSLTWTLSLVGSRLAYTLMVGSFWLTIPLLVLTLALFPAMPSDTSTGSAYWLALAACCGPGCAILIILSTVLSDLFSRAQRALERRGFHLAT